MKSLRKWRANLEIQIARRGKRLWQMLIKLIHSKKLEKNNKKRRKQNQVKILLNKSNKLLKNHLLKLILTKMYSKILRILMSKKKLIMSYRISLSIKPQRKQFLTKRLLNKQAKIHTKIKNYFKYKQKENSQNHNNLH